MKGQGMKGRPAPVAPRGVTFVEILLATVIMAAVILPIASLITGGYGATRETENYNTGINVASDIMDRILSRQIPFAAIDPEGGPDTTLSYGSSRKQAGFRPAYEDLEKQLLSDGGDASERIIKRRNTEFKTFFFAAEYKSTGDGGKDPPKIEEELTFAFFRNPYIPLEAEDRTKVFLDPKRSPYIAEGEEISGDGSDELNNPRHPRCMAAWPWTASGKKDPGKVPEAKDLLAIFNDNAARNSSGWYDEPLVVLSPKQILKVKHDISVMMKIVVGVKWNPGSGRLKGPGHSQQSREFWLVSMKADLDES